MATRFYPGRCDSTPVHLRDQFLLDPDVVFLNHGSFGACPRPVLEKYQQWQRELEREPVEFLARRWDGLIAEVRGELGDYLGARGDDLVFVSNATTGMNVVARSLRLGPEDEVLTTDLEYGAVDFTWDATGARIVRAPLESLWDHVTEATRVLSVSHIASPTGAILPVAELCARARELGLLAVVDGAHAPGHVPVDLAAMGADAYAGNAHKWLCAPKGAGFLWARPELQERLDPLVVSWGRPETEFAKRHEWQGTRDPAAFLSVPAAIEFQREWGWDEVRARCHALVERFVAASGLQATASEFGQMVAVELPPCDPDVVQRRLFDEHRIEVPCFDHGGRSRLDLGAGLQRRGGHREAGRGDAPEVRIHANGRLVTQAVLAEAVLEQPARTRQTRSVRGLPRRPPMTEIAVRAFDQYEAAGWQLVAGLYERVWSPTTRQAVDSLLDAAGVEAGLRVVDVGTGAGDAAGRASERGAQATGIDVAAAMVEIAAGRYPAASFVEASVTDLPSPTSRSMRQSGTSSSSTSASPSGRLERSRESSSPVGALPCRPGTRWCALKEIGRTVLSENFLPGV